MAQLEASETRKLARHSGNAGQVGAEVAFYTNRFYSYKRLISVIINYTNIEHSKYGQEEGCEGEQAQARIDEGQGEEVLECPDKVAVRGGAQVVGEEVQRPESLGDGGMRPQGEAEA